MPERDTNGRFVSGNAGGPGRPKRPTEHDYLARLSEKVTMARWDKIAERAIKDAEIGDRHAREWVSAYLVGKPVTTIELRATDQALLADLLRQCEQRGFSASELFNSMLATLAELPAEVEGGDDV